RRSGRRRRPAPPAFPPPRARARPGWSGTGRTAAVGRVGALGTEAMNFALTEDQARIRDAVREFAEAEITPKVAEREKDERFPHEILARLSEMGVLGMMIPEEYGGAGADALSYVLAVEELARADASIAVIVSVNNSVACYPIWKFGSEEQKRT